MTKSQRKQLEAKLGVFAFRRAQHYLSRGPVERTERAGERIGRLWFRASRKHRERALTNLEMAFPEMPAAERLELAQRVFEHFGRSSADFLAARRRTVEELHASLTVEGREHLDAGRAAGNGVLIITGHIGNWERLAAWLSTSGYPLSVVARDADQAGVNQMVNDLRRIPGTQVISRGNAARPIIEKLRQNELVGILPDQNSDEIFIPFFGKPAGTVLGPGVIAGRTGAAVVPSWCFWEGPGRYRIVFDPILEPDPGYEAKGEGMMRAIHRVLERRIREYPDQWLWMHDRWRSARKRGLI